MGKDSGRGNYITIKSDGGSTVSYFHGSKVLMNKGDLVQAGDVVMLSGNTGKVRGPGGGYHVHVQVKDANGNSVDPKPWITSGMKNATQITDTPAAPGETPTVAAAPQHVVDASPMMIQPTQFSPVPPGGKSYNQFIMINPHFADNLLPADADLLNSSLQNANRYIYQSNQTIEYINTHPRLIASNKKAMEKEATETYDKGVKAYQDMMKQFVESNHFNLTYGMSVNNYNLSVGREKREAKHQNFEENLQGSEHNLKVNMLQNAFTQPTFPAESGWHSELDGFTTSGTPKWKYVPEVDSNGYVSTNAAEYAKKHGLTDWMPKGRTAGDVESEFNNSKLMFDRYMGTTMSAKKGEADYSQYVPMFKQITGKDYSAKELAVLPVSGAQEMWNKYANQMYPNMPTDDYLLQSAMTFASAGKSKEAFITDTLIRRPRNSQAETELLKEKAGHAYDLADIQRRYEY